MLRKAFTSLLTASIFATQVMVSPGLVQVALASERGVFAPAPDFWAERALGVRDAATPKTPAAIKAATALMAFRQSDGVPASLAPLVRAASPYLSVRKIHTGSTNAPAFVLIQDVHMNPQAQKNIGLGLVEIENAHKTAWVLGVEAAHGAFSFESFRRHADAATTRPLADFLLRENKIAAASWFGLISQKNTAFITGIDDATLYSKNVAAFRSASRVQEKTVRLLEKKAADIDAQKNKILSGPAARLYDSISAYHNGSITIADHVIALGRFASLEKSPNLKRLLDGVAREKSLDVEAAAKERDAFAAALSAGKADMDRFPHFKSYLEYMRLADSIEHDAVFSEIHDLTMSAVDTVAKTAAEKNVFSAQRNIQLAQRLARFELTPDEWDEVKRAGGMTELKPFDAFYAIAEKRNSAMLENLLSAMVLKRGATGFFVAGGFHTPGLIRLLNNRGASYVVLTPRFAATENGRGSEYLSAFLRERTPLEKIFSGEKITMASAAQNLGAPQLRPGLDDGSARAWLTQAKLAAATDDGTLTARERDDIRDSAGVPVEADVTNGIGHLTAGPLETTVKKARAGEPTGDTFDIPPYGTFSFVTKWKLSAAAKQFLKRWMPTIVWKILPAGTLLIAMVSSGNLNWTTFTFSAMAMAAVIAKPNDDKNDPASSTENFFGLTSARINPPENSPIRVCPEPIGTGWKLFAAFALDGKTTLAQYAKKGHFAYAVWTTEENGVPQARLSLREDAAQRLFVTAPLVKINDDWDRQRHLAVLYNALSAIERIAFDALAENAPRILSKEEHAYQETLRARHSLRVADSVVAELKDSVSEIASHFKTDGSDVVLSDRLDLYILLSHMRGTIPPLRPVYKEPVSPAIRFGLLVDPKKSGIESALIRQLVGNPDMSLKVIVGAKPSQIFAILNSSRYGRFVSRNNIAYNDSEGWLRIHNSYIWVVESATNLPSEEWQRLGIWTFASTYDGHTTDTRNRLADAVFGIERNPNDTVNLISVEQIPLRGKASAERILYRSKDTDSPAEPKSIVLPDSPSHTVHSFLNALWELPLFVKLRAVLTGDVALHMDVPATRQASTLDESGRTAAGITNQLALDTQFVRSSLHTLGIDAGVVNARTLPIEMGGHTVVNMTFDQRAFLKAIEANGGPRAAKAGSITENEMEERIKTFLIQTVLRDLNSKGVRNVYTLAGNAYVRGDSRLHLDMEETAVTFSHSRKSDHGTITLSFSFFYDPDWQNAQNLLKTIKTVAEASPLNIQDHSEARDPRESEYGYMVRLSADRRTIPPHPLTLPSRINLIPRPLDIGVLGASGRIGHLLMRGLVGELNLRVRAVSGPTSVDELLTSIRKDSAHGAPLSNGREINLVREQGPEGTKGAFRINQGIPIMLLPRYNSPAQIPWAKFNVRMAVDASGKFDDPTEPSNLAGHTKQARGKNDQTGADLALFTGPFKVKDKTRKAPDTTIVLPVTPEQRVRAALETVNQPIIFSAASCTTNCLVVLMDALNRMWKDNDFMNGLIALITELAPETTLQFPFDARLSGSTMVTVHATTNSQSIEDVMTAVDAKKRAALNSISLMETGASSASKQVGVEGDWAKQILAIAARAQADTGSVVILTAVFHLLQDGVWPAELQSALSKKKKELELGIRQLVLDFHRRLSQQAPYRNILEIAEPDEAFTSQHAASTDATAVFDAKQLQVEFSPETGRLVIMPQGWYDNERGSYTSQVLRLLNRIATLNYEEYQRKKAAARRLIDIETAGFDSLINALVNKFGARVTGQEPLTIVLHVSRDGLIVEQALSPVEKSFFNLRYTGSPIEIGAGGRDAAIHLLSSGITETAISIPPGADINQTLVQKLSELSFDPDLTVFDWALAMNHLNQMQAMDAMPVILDRLQTNPDARASLRQLIGTEWIATALLSQTGHGRFIAFVRYVFQTILGGDITTLHSKDIEILELLQRETLRRLSRSNLTEDERGGLSRLNESLFSHLVRIATTSEPHHRGTTLNAILRGFVFADSIGAPYNSAAWGQINSKSWTALRRYLSVYKTTPFDTFTAMHWNGGLSFVPNIGLDIWQSAVESMVTVMLQNHGKKRSDIYAPETGVPLLNVWQLVDSSSDPALKKTLYRVLARAAKNETYLAAFLEYAALQPTLFSRVMALISIARQITHWQFNDNKMPWDFVIHALRAPFSYADIKFKRLFVRAALKNAPTVLGLPRDSDIRDFAKSGKTITRENLYNDEYDLDSAIDRQLTFVGINNDAIDLVEARFEWWRTGDPARAVEALQWIAPRETKTWRATVTPGAPRAHVKKLFELLNGQPTSTLAMMTDAELSVLKDQLDAQMPDAPDDIARLFKIEIPLYRELVRRFGNGEDDFNGLRAKSNSGVPINQANIDLDEFNLDRLIHREIHHHIGEHTLDLVEARFEAWRTGNMVPAIQLAERIAPAQTKTWRATTSTKVDPKPLVEALFRHLGNIPTAALATISAHHLDSARVAMDIEFPGQEENIRHLFNTEIQLFRLLKKRYAPARRDAALAALKADEEWPVDVSGFIKTVDIRRSPHDQLAELVRVRTALTPYLERTAEVREQEKDAGEHRDGYVYDGIVQQHEVRGIYGYTVKDPYYKAFLLDKLLQSLEQDLLEQSRALLDTTQPSYVHDAGRLLSRTIELLLATGWGNQPLRNMQDLLLSPALTPGRLLLIADSIAAIYQSLGYWSDRQAGEIIDAFSLETSFDELSPALKQSLKVNNAQDFENVRLRMRTHIQSDLLRNNFPLFYLKDLALSIINHLENHPAPHAGEPRAASPSTAAFFPEALFGDAPIKESLAVDSEKGANLFRLSRMGVDVPLGVRYSIGSNMEAVWQRVNNDLKRVVATINTNNLSEDLGSDYGTNAVDPILFSIRSGAIFDAPGQQHTVTNWGVSLENIGALSERIGEWGAWDSLRRYYQEYAMAVLHMDRSEFRKIMDEFKKSLKKDLKEDFTPNEMKAVALLYKNRIIEEHGVDAIPSSLDEQLKLIIKAILDSWDNEAMRTYRKSRGMEDEEGSAIILQAMVKGNYSANGASTKISGAGAVFSGIWPWENISGSFAHRVEGSDIADGVITPMDIEVLRKDDPDLYAHINTITRKISAYYGTRVQLEYTIQNGTFRVLQVRSVPEEGSVPVFDLTGISRTKIVADGYSLSGRAVKGPTLSISHLRQAVTAVESYLATLENKPDLNGGTLDALISFLVEALSKQENDEKHAASLKLFLTAVRTVDQFRKKDAPHASQIGLIVVSDESPPEDLRFVRYFNELTSAKLVVGTVSNRGGPGAHEQENAIHLGLTTMAGTSFGEAQSRISFEEEKSGVIVFSHGDRKPVAVKEGAHMVSLMSLGKIMRVYQGSLRFMDSNGAAASPLLDSLFKSGTDDQFVYASPKIEEWLFRFAGMALVPVAVLGFLIAPGALSASPTTTLLKIGSVVAASSAVSAAANALAHRPESRAEFFYRLRRAAHYSLIFAGSFVPAMLGLLIVTAPFLPLDKALLGTLAVLSGVVAARASEERHRRHNQDVLDQRDAVVNAKKTIAELLLKSGTDNMVSANDWTTWLGEKNSSGLPLAGLKTWRQVTPSMIESEMTDVLDGRSALHFSLKDLTDASTFFNEGAGVYTLRAKLTQIARILRTPETKPASIVLTIGSSQSDENAIYALQLLFQQFRVSDLPSVAQIKARLIFDHSDKADPFLAAHLYKTALNGRKLHAFPMRIGRHMNWRLDFDALAKLDAESVQNVLIDVINLATGLQTRLENLPALMRQVLTAA